MILSKKSSQKPIWTKKPILENIFDNIIESTINDAELQQLIKSIENEQIDLFSQLDLNEAASLDLLRSKNMVIFFHNKSRISKPININNNSIHYHKKRGTFRITNTYYLVMSLKMSLRQLCRILFSILFNRQLIRRMIS